VSNRSYLVVSVLAAALATALATLVLRPGRSDLPSSGLTGIEAADDGYWTAPLRDVAGSTRQDAYDERLALSLALPENAAGALAHRLGVSAGDARFAGSILALLATLCVAALYRRVLPLLLTLGLLLLPPMLAHVRSDLGEGTAFGLVALFGYAIVRGHLGLAAFVAGLGIFQKACGWPLGVGVLAAVLEGPNRWRRLLRAAVFATAGVGAAALVATVVFGDAPLDFALRPFVATRETGAAAGPDVRSWLLRAAFPTAYGVGAWFLPVTLAAWILVPGRRVRAPILAALLAGCGFSGVFPDPWRVLPTFLLLPALFAEPVSARSARPDVAVRLASAWLLVLSAVAVVGTRDAGPRALALTAALAIVVDAARARRPADHRTRSLLASAVAAVALFVVGPRLPDVLDPGSARLEFARTVAARVPADAHVIGYCVLAPHVHGTLYYPPFVAHWQAELARPGAPRTIYRVRSQGATMPPPAGFVIEATEPLGTPLYAHDAPDRSVVLDHLVRR